MMLAREEAILERMVANTILKAKTERLDTNIGVVYIAYGRPTYNADHWIGFWAIEGAAQGPIESFPGKSEAEFRQAILEHAADFLGKMKPRGLLREGKFNAG